MNNNGHGKRNEDQHGNSSDLDSSFGTPYQNYRIMSNNKPTCQIYNTTVQQNNIPVEINLGRQPVQPVRNIYEYRQEPARRRNHSHTQARQYIREHDDSKCQTMVFVLIIAFFLIFVLSIFGIFIYIVVQQTYQLKGPYYEIIQSSKSDDGITLLASCKKCPEYYGNQNNPFASHLNLTVRYISASSFEFYIKGINFTDEFQVPNQNPFINSDFDTHQILQRDYLLSLRENPLELIVTRKSTKEKVFYFSSVDLLYSQEFKKIKVKIPTNYTYGIGERNGQFRLPNGKYTLWNQRSSRNQQTGQPSQNMNGYHPMYLQQELSKNFHIVYLRAANAMEVKKNHTEITYSLLAGSLNFVIFLSDGSVQGVVKQYQSYIGTPQIPPFWSLGYHHYYQKFSSIQDLKYLVQNYTENQLTLDVLWMDQSYLKNGQAFNYDSNSFPIKELKDVLKDIKVIPAMQPGIKIVDSAAYIEGVKRNIFITEADQTILSGKNREGDSVHYPDFFSPQILDYWDEMFINFYNQIQIDGIYFYDNEITDYSHINGYDNKNSIEENLQQKKDEKYLNINKALKKKHSTGKQKSEMISRKNKSHQSEQNQNTQLNHSHTLSNSLSIEDDSGIKDFYIPDNKDKQEKIFSTYLPNQEQLQYNSLNFSAEHGNYYLKEFNTHNLFSLQQTYATSQYLSQFAKQQLPFVISKATYPGIGKYSGHLVSLPSCSWEALQDTVPSLLNFNMFGIPLTGYGLCLSSQNSENSDSKSEQTDTKDVQLIARWLQISVFFPFSISKSDPTQLPISTNTFLLKQMQNLIKLRYQLSVYIYSQFFNYKIASVYQPLFFQYQKDEQVYEKDKYSSRQFLVGESIMVCPILEPNKIQITAYFPQDDWFDFKSGVQVKSIRDPGGELRVYSDISSNVPIFIKGGSILPLLSVNKIASLNENQGTYTLVIAFVILDNGSMFAQGYMLGKQNLDSQSVYESCIQENCLLHIQATAQSVVERPPLKSYYKVNIKLQTEVPFMAIDTFDIDQFIFFNLQEDKLELKKTVKINSENMDFTLTVSI